MAESFSLFLEKYFSSEVVVFLVSLFPILEVRGGLVVSKLLGLPWAVGYPLSILGNAIPIPFILLFIKRILRFLSEHGPIKKLAYKMETMGKSKGLALTTKYSRGVFLGLFLFVAIPLPGTGAWTGALIAALLDLPKQKALPVILLGIIGASLVMTFIAYIMPGAFGI